MHPAYFSEELKKNCKKLAYVPYYVNAGFISDGYIDLPLLHRADYLFFNRKELRRAVRDMIIMIECMLWVHLNLIR